MECYSLHNIAQYSKDLRLQTDRKIRRLVILILDDLFAFHRFFKSFCFYLFLYNLNTEIPQCDVIGKPFLIGYG